MKNFKKISITFILVAILLFILWSSLLIHIIDKSHILDKIGIEAKRVDRVLDHLQKDTITIKTDSTTLKFKKKN